MTDKIYDYEISTNYSIDAELFADVNTVGTMVPYGSTWVSLGDIGATLEDLRISAYYRQGELVTMRMDWERPTLTEYYKRAPGWVKKLIDKIDDNINEILSVYCYESKAKGK